MLYFCDSVFLLAWVLPPDKLLWWFWLLSFLKKKNSSEINSDFSSAQCLHIRSRALTDGQLFQSSLEDIDRRHGNNVTFIVSVWLGVCGLTEMLNHLSSSTLLEDEMKAGYKGVCLLVLELFFQESNNSVETQNVFEGMNISGFHTPIKPLTHCEPRFESFSANVVDIFLW